MNLRDLTIILFLENIHILKTTFETSRGLKLFGFNS
jgi:hypothetical protein